MLTRSLIALAAGLAALPLAAEACSCMVSATVEEKLAQTEIAFIGVPEETSRAPGASETDDGFVDNDRHETRFTVLRSYRGPDAPTLDVSHLLSSAACGTQFQPGRPQLIFAYAQEDGTLTTNSCTLITYTRDDKSVFDALEAGYKGKWWW
jgi:hypothetical protein